MKHYIKPPQRQCTGPDSEVRGPTTGVAVAACPRRFFARVGHRRRESAPQPPQRRHGCFGGEGSCAAGVRMAGSTACAGAAARLPGTGTVGPRGWPRLDRPLPRPRVADSVGAANAPSAPSEGDSAEMPSSDCKRRARMRRPPPAAATMSARTALDEGEDGA